jgi:hypothetical protein
MDGKDKYKQKKKTQPVPPRPTHCQCKTCGRTLGLRKCNVNGHNGAVYCGAHYRRATNGVGATLVSLLCTTNEEGAFARRLFYNTFPREVGCCSEGKQANYSNSPGIYHHLQKFAYMKYNSDITLLTHIPCTLTS